MTSVLQQGKMEEGCSGLETTGKGSTQELASSSEDSSYDSDYCCEISEESNPHNDVSRTVSDTLAQEFNEYVTCSDKPNMGVQGFDTNYVAKVDFARKLGYTEDQVKRALRKLGPLATQNELLAELIQIDVEGGSSHSGCATPSIRLASVETKLEDKLRHIIIDGSNVAMSHGSNKVFSSHGIRIAVDYFRARGHKEITVFLPMFRKEHKPDDPVTDPKILKDLESEGVLVWTPSKIINNKRMVCYDDRYVLKLAHETDGIVVSNDNYRDLASESVEFKKVVEERTLMYSFVNDRFMPPEDPLGRHGPTLEQFLQCNTTARTAKKIPCPYGHKCTFGSKCKYFHTTKKISVSEQLRKQAAMKTTSLPILSQERVVKQACIRTKSAVLDSAVKPTLSVYQTQETVPGAKHQLKYRNSYGCPPTTAVESITPASINGHRKLQRQPSVNPNLLPQEVSRKAPEEPRSQLFQNLAAIFPPDRVRHVMTLYPEEKDPQVICRHILEIFK